MSATSADIRELTRQLGRPVRGVVGIGARCVCGNPLVAITAPRLPDGTPFPTMFYLTHPAVVKAASQLEARGEMQRYNEQLADDPQLRAAYQRAHDDYLHRREKLGTVTEIAGISAGGMPTRVKCLHALIAHALAVGAGINPIGDAALRCAATEGLWQADRCECEHPRVADDREIPPTLAQ
ncbi:MAG: DUF501 domain-containing protein [Bowdeniella nasicola]|nr:DUF501 domain-containing protein [Bowdeniella nasicola]